MNKRVVTFGEIMLRLKSPGFERLFQSPVLEATFGGGEANVAVSLANFGLDAAFASVLPANAVADACIAAQNAVVAAESMGIGSCYIGDVIENVEAMRDALHLPDFVVPACMLVFGRPTEQQQRRPKPARFAEAAVVCENTYHDRTPDELRADFTARAAANGQPDYDFDKAVTAFCNRKYASDFSQEMTRSAEIYWKEFE